jgi:hypothetical protein
VRFAAGLRPSTPKSVAPRSQAQLQPQNLGRVTLAFQRAGAPMSDAASLDSLLIDDLTDDEDDAFAAALDA